MTVTITKPAFNLREALNAAKKKTGLFGEQVIRAETSDDYFKTIGTNKNLLINGCFRFAQRGTSISNPSGNQYLLDRWFFGTSQPSCTVSQGTENLPDGTYAKTLRVDWSASGSNWLDIYQGIEEYQRVNNKTITMSAWVRTNLPRWKFRQYGMSSYGQEFPSNGQWHKVVATFNTDALTLTRGSSTGSAFFGMACDADHVSGSFVEFANVQLELGSNATPFEYRHLQQELALCQRYFEVNGNMYVRNTGTTTQEMRITWVFKTQKRATPTISVGTGGSTGVSVHCATVYQSDIAGGAVYDTSSQFTASAEL